MAGRGARLTALGAGRLKEPGMHPDGLGLYLRITESGARSWVYRYQLAGKRRHMGLGGFPAISLARARELAGEARAQLAEGIDPLEARKDGQAPQKAVLTFDEAAAAFIQAHAPGWRNPKHRQQWKNTLATYVSPVIGDKAVDLVDVDDVLAILSPIWTEKPETAGRVRGRMENILDWARVRGLRQGENVARWRGHLSYLLPAKTKVHKVTHHRALPIDEMPGFMARLLEQPGLAALALRFTILTAARTGEALGARWEEIDWQAAVWTVPTERMKGGREHRVPLSGAALDVLRLLPADEEGFIWPGAGKAGERAKKPLSGMAMAMALRRMDVPVTTHGFRSVFRSWISERTDFPGEAAEMALAHKIPSAVEAAYRRTDLLERRREMMVAWAAYCLGKG